MQFYTTLLTTLVLTSVSFAKPGTDMGRCGNGSDNKFRCRNGGFLFDFEKASETCKGKNSDGDNKVIPDSYGKKEAGVSFLVLDKNYHQIKIGKDYMRPVLEKVGGKDPVNGFYGTSKRDADNVRSEESSKIDKYYLRIDNRQGLKYIPSLAVSYDDDQGTRSASGDLLDIDGNGIKSGSKARAEQWKISVLDKYRKPLTTIYSPRGDWEKMASESKSETDSLHQPLRTQKMSGAVRTSYDSTNWRWSFNADKISTWPECGNEKCYAKYIVFEYVGLFPDDFNKREQIALDNFDPYDCSDVSKGVTYEKPAPEWAEWSIFECTVSGRCGQNGVLSRTRVDTTGVHSAEREVGDKFSTVECEVCGLEEWSTWSECSYASCESLGLQTRKRGSLAATDSCNAVAEVETQSQTCGQQQCCHRPIDFENADGDNAFVEMDYHPDITFRVMSKTCSPKTYTAEECDLYHKNGQVMKPILEKKGRDTNTGFVGSASKNHDTVMPYSSQIGNYFMRTYNLGDGWFNREIAQVPTLLITYKNYTLAASGQIYDIDGSTADIKNINGRMEQWRVTAWGSQGEILKEMDSPMGTTNSLLPFHPTEKDSIGNPARVKWNARYNRWDGGYDSTNWFWAFNAASEASWPKCGSSLCAIKDITISYIGRYPKGKPTAVGLAFDNFDAYGCQDPEAPPPPPPPVACDYSEWSHWTCDKTTCGLTGTDKRTRDIIYKDDCFAPEAAELIQGGNACETDPCPCDVSEWSDWSCGVVGACGQTGTLRRSRYFFEDGKCETVDGIELQDDDNVACGTELCVCELSDWSDWVCSESDCGTVGVFESERAYIVTKHCRHGDDELDRIGDKCETELCPCTPGAWTAWECSVSGECGQIGVDTRTRALDEDSDASDCDGTGISVSQEGHLCSTADCCVASEWNTWACSETVCGSEGVYQSSRKMIEDDTCQISVENTMEIEREGEKCFTEKCPCELGDWSEWRCNLDPLVCGLSGVVTRQRSVEDSETCMPPTSGVTRSLDFELVQTETQKPCTTPDCCVLTDWGEWSCSVSGKCGLQGTYERERSYHKSNKCIEPLSGIDLVQNDNKVCETEACECPLSPWSAWACSVTECGSTGELASFRGYIVGPSCQVMNAELRRVHHSKDCTTAPCACEAGVWSAWSCTADETVCGSTGKSVRTRLFSKTDDCALPEGVRKNEAGEIYGLEVSGACSSPACCELTPWSQWMCSVTDGCGLTGQLFHERTPVVTDSCLVNDLDVLRYTADVPCYTAKCECPTTAWSSWSCSATKCSTTGQQQSSRSYIITEDCQTLDTELVRKGDVCEAEPCSCESTGWSNWQCSANESLCGSSGREWRERKYTLDDCVLPPTVVVDDEGVELAEGKTCYARDCCDTTAWNEWSCTVGEEDGCGLTGKLVRYRTFVEDDTCTTAGAKTDLRNTEGTPCFTDKCECKLTEWSEYRCSEDGCGTAGVMYAVRGYEVNDACQPKNADLRREDGECVNELCPCEPTKWTQWSCSADATVCGSPGYNWRERVFDMEEDCTLPADVIVSDEGVEMKQGSSCTSTHCCGTTAWSSWACSFDNDSGCGLQGKYVRERTFIETPGCMTTGADTDLTNTNGQLCETEKCECLLSPWSDYQCSATKCGSTGTRFSTRGYITTPDCITKSADLRREDGVCATDACVCEPEEWSDWSCVLESDQCGITGNSVRTRKYDLTDCTLPVAEETQDACTEMQGKCVHDCRGKDWRDSSNSPGLPREARAYCNSLGMQHCCVPKDVPEYVASPTSPKPVIVVIDEDGIETEVGDKCSALSCCAVAPWSGWTCSVSEELDGCGVAGEYTRVREYIATAACITIGADKDLVESLGEKCWSAKCECDLTSWSKWACSEKACGSTGVMTSTRGYKTNDDCQTKDAILYREGAQCATEACECESTNWSSWECSADATTCGSWGINTRTRTYNTTDCVVPESVVVTKEGIETGVGGICSAMPCCGTSEWSNWTCSVSTRVDGCGQTGKYLRERSFEQTAKCITDGASSILRNTEDTPCFTDLCECELSEWSSYKCSVEACGSEGILEADRGYITNADCQVMDAVLHREDGVCQTEPCECDAGEWTLWSCSADEAICGSAGQQWRERKYDTTDCIVPDSVKIDENGMERRIGGACTATPCCVTTPWNGWSCSVSGACGLTGRYVRDRAYIEDENCSIAGADTDLHNTEGIECHTEKCECELTDWSEYKCNKSKCGSEGQLVKTRGYITTADCEIRDAELEHEGDACETEPCVCESTIWTEWMCSLADTAKCGSRGSYTRTRNYDLEECILPVSVEVDADGTETDTGVECEAKPCCGTTLWSNWACSRSTEVDGCGKTGKLFRERAFLETPQCTTEGADTELRNTENSLCHTDLCECELSEWSDYKCSEEACGSEGVLEADRGYITNANCQVMDAVLHREDGVCRTEPCECNASVWTLWACSADEAVCGSAGQQWRERKYDTTDCVVPDTVKVNEDGIERRSGGACTATPCCVTTPWNDWYCSVSEVCGLTGRYVRDRAFIEDENCSIAGADTDLHNTEGIECHTEKCECELTDWSEYECNEVKCGSEGQLVKTRGYITTADCEVRDAELEHEVGVCETEPCVCESTIWTEWMCSLADPSKCGSRGSYTRTRVYDLEECDLPESVVVDADGVETATGSECEAKPCCGTTLWSDWACSRSTEVDGCGKQGKLVRERAFVELDGCMIDGAKTDLRNTENEKCLTDLCECELSEWSDYKCDEDACGSEGVLVANRGYITNANCQVMDAILHREDGVCRTEPCECNAGEWTLWACSADEAVCGSAGQQWRERKYDTTDCVVPDSVKIDEDGFERRSGGACTATPCCITTPWNDWYCSVSGACGLTGRYVRDRAFIQDENCSIAGADTDLHNTEGFECHTEKCECELTDWSEYKCNKSKCGSEGQLVKTRGYITTTDCEAKDAELEHEGGVCETEPCVCESSVWTECSLAEPAKCGSRGSYTRTRNYDLEECILPVSVEVDADGKETDTGVQCSATPCCDTSEWASWTCSATTEVDGCGQQGKLIRERTFIETDFCTTQGADTDLRNTENEPCYTDLCECELSLWSEYKCSEDACGSEGVMEAVRGYITNPNCQVMNAEVRRVDGKCSTDPCICEATVWTTWACSADENYCGATGSNLRQRAYNSSNCELPESIQTDDNGVEIQKGTACTATPCCGTSDWSPWGCSVSLEVDGCNAHGKYVRDRTFLRTDDCSTAHAQTDLHDSNNAVCHTEKCACETTEWTEYVCDVTDCGSEGVLVSTRGYITTPTCDPKDAELSREDGKCKTELCDCPVSVWSSWVCDSDADVCGSAGFTYRQRKHEIADCKLPANTKTDEDGVETQRGSKCHTKSCCELSDWNDWSCSVSEDDGCSLTGMLVRDRVFLETEDCTTAGDDADLHDTDNKACHTSMCECELSEWAAQPCDCDECSCVGNIYSTRYYKEHDGCQAMDAELRRLDDTCESEPCYVHPTEWTLWSCDAPVVCGFPGQRYRERSYDMEQGVLRDGVVLNEDNVEKDVGEKCHYTPCCETSEWSLWTCTVNNEDHECGVAGRLEQYRTFKQIDGCSIEGDETLLVKTDNEVCHTDKCECELSEWTEYKCSETKCSSSGVMESKRYYETGPDCEAKNAELNRVDGTCDTEICECEVSGWTNWVCSADMHTCGSEGALQRSRTYTVTEDCEIPEDTVMDDAGLEVQTEAACQSTPCCDVTHWNDWTCTVDNDDGCGLEGHYIRERKYVQTDDCSTEGDDTDLTNTDNVVCKTDKCECPLSDWSDFACSAKACGSTGVMQASRWYIIADNCQTMDADLHVEGDACETPACTCDASPWSEYVCDADVETCNSVGVNSQYRIFNLTDCVLPADVHTDENGREVAHNGACRGPVCCDTTQWGEWTCSVQTLTHGCNQQGRFMRERSFVEDGACVVAGADIDLRNVADERCSTDKCPCEMTMWSPWECDEKLCDTVGEIESVRGYILNDQCQAMAAETRRVNGSCVTALCKCKPSPWSEWECELENTDCGATGYNTRHRTYDIDSDKCDMPEDIVVTDGGVEYDQGSKCSGTPCCAVLEWSQWSCNVDAKDGCGVTGRLARNRTFVETDQCTSEGDKTTLSEVSNEACSTELCECPLSNWSGWQCSVETCGSTGEMESKRGYITDSTNCQTMDAELIRAGDPCSTEDCPCKASNWGEWVCSADLSKCGQTGKMLRQREFKNIADCLLNEKAEVSADAKSAVETESKGACSSTACCALTPWVEWTCSSEATCGVEGKLSRTREHIEDENCSLIGDEAVLVDGGSATCMRECPECETTEWNDWVCSVTECSSEGVYEQKRTYIPNEQCQSTGSTKLVKTGTKCETEECACQPGDWAEWRCDAATNVCGQSGAMVRERAFNSTSDCQLPAAAVQQKDGTAIEAQYAGACNGPACCKLSDWSSWVCSVSGVCGQMGQEYRERSRIQTLTCLPDTEDVLRDTNNKACGTEACECPLSPWNEWRCNVSACGSTGKLRSERGYVVSADCVAKDALLVRLDGDCETEACKCKADAWSTWSCSADSTVCGSTGFNTRSRQFEVTEDCVLPEDAVVDENGTHAQQTESAEICMGPRCCKLSEWGPNTCSVAGKACGSQGTNFRERTHIVTDTCLPDPSDALRTSDNEKCFTAKCECPLTSWSEATCDAEKCGTSGALVSTRGYVLSDDCEPKHAALRKETGRCQSPACVCTPSTAWSEWVCSAAAGVCDATGTQWRQRAYDLENCTPPATTDISAEGIEIDMGEACSAMKCCDTTAWGEWACSVDTESDGCGKHGKEIRERFFITTSDCITTGSEVELHNTNNVPCQSDLCECKLTDWTTPKCSVTDCSSTGVMESERVYMTGPDCQAMDAELYKADGECETEACPCEVTKWSEWLCDSDQKICGSAGYTWRERTYTLDECELPANLQVEDGVEKQRGVACASKKCCDTTSWGEWICSKTFADGCGLTGKEVRTRSFVVDETCSVEGSDAQLRNTENTPCYTAKCECELSPWSEYKCSESVCDTDGVMQSSRFYITTPDCQPLDAELVRGDEVCHTDLCDCEVGEWSLWACSADESVCGSTGRNTRHRSYADSECALPANLLLDGARKELQLGAPCSATPCCVVAPWSEYECSVSEDMGCGLEGVLVRDRAFVHTDACSTKGAMVPLHDVDTSKCYTSKCECTLSEWSPYTCSATVCSTAGEMESVRFYNTNDSCQEMDAELIRKDGACQAEACICKAGAWSEPVCDADESVCGSTGYMTKTRTFEMNENCVLPENTVVDGLGVETKRGDTCAAKPCCSTTPWASWQCSVSIESDGCGSTGKLVRDRALIENVQCSVAGIEVVLRNTDNILCHTDKCPCELTSWTSWRCSERACSSEGVLEGFRGHVVHDDCQVIDAETYRTNGTCATEACECKPTGWSPWSCTAQEDMCSSAGLLVRERRFALDECVVPEHIVIDVHGVETQTHSAPCYAKPCCDATMWSEWVCSVADETQCGLEGKYVRVRSFVETDSCTTSGSDMELRTTENVPCSNTKCECPLTVWTDYKCSETLCGSTGDMYSTRSYITDENCITKDAETYHSNGTCETEACVCEPSKWSGWACDADEQRCSSPGHNWRQRVYDLGECVLPETIVTDDAGVEVQKGGLCAATECCQTSPWSEYVCTVNYESDGCGATGKLVRSREYLENSMCTTAGADSDLFHTDNEACYTDKCECQLTPWTMWTCSEKKLCGTDGVVFAQRGYVVTPDCQPKDAETYKTNGVCHTEACPCESTEWSEWVCDLDSDMCGLTGTNWRQRKFDTEQCDLPANIVTNADGFERQTHAKPCYGKECCDTTSWGEWYCSVEDEDMCGLTGKYVRDRAFNQTDGCSTVGADDDLRNTENVMCKNDLCECLLTEWTDYKCSATTCGAEGVLEAFRGYETGPDCQTKNADTYRTGDKCSTEECECKHSEWSSWECSANVDVCGSSGYDMRYRELNLTECALPVNVVTDASGVETQRGAVCHSAECCGVTPWTEFVCTATLDTDGCGVAGKLQRTRAIIEENECSTAGVDIELMNTDNVDCATDACECPLTAWTTPKCNETLCGTQGVMYATRGYIVGPTCQTMNAETYKIVGNCETEECECAVSGWSTWVCDADVDICGSSGASWRERTFTIEDCVLPEHIIVDEAGVERQRGAKCDALPCCETTSWSEYMCTVSDADGCGLSGKLVRTRSYVHAEGCTIAGAHVDLRHTDNEQCFTDKCECELTPWTDYTCSETACSSEGILFSTRGYIPTEQCQIKYADTYREGETCKTETCVCAPSAWTEWLCDADDAFCSSPGDTYRQRKFETDDCVLPSSIVTNEEGFEVQKGSACTAKQCCDVTEWNEWTCSVGETDGCSVSGEYVRDRAYIETDACTTAGDDTDLHNTDNVPCHTELCECRLTDWTPWKCSETACSSTGDRYSSRGYITGPHCQSKGAETYRTDGKCETELCPCDVGEWTQWTCSADEAVCGSHGKTFRQREYLGEVCELPDDIEVDNERVETQIGATCRATECCNTSEWSEFMCSVNTHVDGCGVEGKLIRERAFIETGTCSTAGANVDLRNTDDIVCHTDKCECPLTPWSEYSCSATKCGTEGVLYALRGYISGSNCQTMDAETRKEDGVCSTEACECKPTNWSRWICDADVNVCGSRGQSKRYRQYDLSMCTPPAEVVVSATGVETDIHEDDCYAPACCETSPWTNWACSVSDTQGCGLSGELVRTRGFIENGKCITDGAETDLFDTNNEMCQTEACECPLTEWSEYVCSESVCSSEGVMTSSRGYVSGSQCRTLGADTVRTGEVCKTPTCDCIPTKWSEKVCSADMDVCGSVGNYIQTRQFNTTECNVPDGIITDDEGVETRVSEACAGPICCDVSPWNGWSCTVAESDGCGLTGHSIRVREYLHTDECSVAGAKTVLVNNGDDECSTELCECEMTEWTEYVCSETTCSSQGEWVASRGYITASDCQTRTAETRRVDGVCHTDACECTPTAWTQWGCDADETTCDSVGTNWRERHFNVTEECVLPNEVGVDADGVERQTSAQACYAKSCCATSSWGDWECSVSTATDGCNRGGHYVRERTFIDTDECSTAGSDVTLRNTENEACFTDVCECPLTEWSVWSCSESLCSSEGVRESMRGYVTSTDCEVRDATLYREDGVCATPDCPCKPSEWSGWECDVDATVCGNSGTNKRHRKFDLQGCVLPIEVTTDEQGVQVESGVSCEGPVCCDTNQWSTWSCSLSTHEDGCGLSGRLERTRDHILVEGCMVEGDDTDLYNTNNDVCHTDLCECDLSEWSPYECSEDACSSQGVSYSTRAYLVEDDCQTMDADLYREDGTCETPTCVCEPSEWTQWSCDADETTCGSTGSTWRHRTYDLDNCEVPEDVTSDAEGIEIQQGGICHSKDCCQVSDWGEWACSVDTNQDGCGAVGTHVRSREFITTSNCMVEGVEISLEESDGVCSTDLCECELTDWSEGVCDAPETCSSEGVLRSTRGYITNERCQTLDAALHRELGVCGTEVCTCEPDGWTEWSCNADMDTCDSKGEMWRTRSFDLTKCALPEGVHADENGLETQMGEECRGPECCDITPWGDWVCDVNDNDGCGQTGHEIRTREHIEDGECMILEKATLVTSDGESCTNELCECALEEWSNWVCSETACGVSGVQIRTRSYLADDDCHTNEETSLLDTSNEVCTNEACPCMPTWADWGEVSSCTSNEATGTQCTVVADQRAVNAPVSSIVSGAQSADNAESYCVDLCQRKGIQTCDSNGMAPTSFARTDLDEASTCAYTEEICECPCETVPEDNNTPIIAGAAVGAAALLAAAGAAMWYRSSGNEAVAVMDGMDALGQNLQTNPVYEGDFVEQTNDLYADYV